MCLALKKKTLPSNLSSSKQEKVSSPGCSLESGRKTSVPGFRPSTYTGGLATWYARATRHHDGDDHPLQGPEHDYPGQGSDGPDELRPSYLEDGAELPRLDQPDRVYDHHCRQRGLRHQRYERGKKEHGDERSPGSDQLEQLRTRSGQAVHNRLSSAAPGG